jgi:HK97 family phage major capsid protein
MKFKVKTLKDLQKLMKAVTIGSGGAANPFLPSPLASAFIDIVTENNTFRKVFRSVKMNSRTRTIPKFLTGTNVYYQSAEATQGQETTFTASSIQLTAKKLFAWIEISEETFEDGVTDMNEAIKMLFARGMGIGEEKAFLVGDVDHAPTTAVEASADATTWFNKDSRLAFDGIVTIGRESGTKQIVNGAATVDVFGEAIYRLGLYAKQTAQLIAYVNPWSANQLMRDSDVKTVDKYGPKATLLTGEVGEIFNKFKIINSDYIPNGQGVVTHKDNVVLGDRRLIKMKEDEIIKNDSVVWAISERVAMEVEYDAAVLFLQGFSTPTAS